MVKKLTCSKDIVDAIHKHQLLSNENRKRINLDPIITKAYEIDYQHLNSILRYFRKVKNVRLYYNFFTDKNFNLRSTILSDLRDSRSISFKDSFETPEQDEINKIEKRVENNFTLGNFNNKMNNLRKLLSSTDSPVQKNLSDTEFEDETPELNFCTEKCTGCNKSLKFNLGSLRTNEKSINFKDIILELFEHSHQKYKKSVCTGKNRNKHEAVQELIKHYQINHHS